MSVLSQNLVGRETILLGDAVLFLALIQVLWGLYLFDTVCYLFDICLRLFVSERRRFVSLYSLHLLFKFIVSYSGLYLCS